MSQNEKKPVTFMSDDEGNPSAMRMMSMIALVIAILLAIAPIFNWGSGGKSEHVLYFLIAAFAPKAMQKFAEKKP